MGENFSKNLYEIRKAKRMVLRELSEKTKIRVLTISELENGKRKPSFDYVVRLAEGLGVKVNDLLGTDTGEEPKVLFSCNRTKE